MPDLLTSDTSSRLPAEQVTLDRLEDQLRWYDRRSRLNRALHKCFKTFTIASAAMIPALTTSGVHSATQLAGVLGVLIAVLEGIQQLNQYQANWASYRTTAEALEREKYFYLAHAGPYLTLSDPHPVLAERVESLCSQENAKWLVSQSQVSSKASSIESDRLRSSGPAEKI